MYAIFSLLNLSGCRPLLNVQLMFIIAFQVTDSMMMKASFVYPENTPTTKEGYYYRMIFEKFFPKVCKLHSCKAVLVCVKKIALVWNIHALPHIYIYIYIFLLVKGNLAIPPT